MQELSGYKKMLVEKGWLDAFCLGSALPAIIYMRSYEELRKSRTIIVGFFETTIVGQMATIMGTYSER